jgi:hypothetical protein
MSFGIYLVGCLILIGGLAIAANMLRVPRKWIGVVLSVSSVFQSFMAWRRPDERTRRPRPSSSGDLAR